MHYNIGCTQCDDFAETLIKSYVSVFLPFDYWCDAIPIRWRLSRMAAKCENEWHFDEEERVWIRFSWIAFFSCWNARIHHRWTEPKFSGQIFDTSFSRKIGKHCQLTKECYSCSSGNQNSLAKFSGQFAPSLGQHSITFCSIFLASITWKFVCCFRIRSDIEILMERHQNEQIQFSKTPIVFH